LYILLDILLFWDYIPNNINPRSIPMKFSLQLKSALLPGLIASALILSACSGGSSSSSGSNTGALNSTSSRGLITGFGSVYVNGVKYDTVDTQFDANDDNNDNKVSQSDLHVGQFVTVTGSIDANGTTGQASLISYKSELQGPVKNITTDPADPTGQTGTMEVLGRLVTVDANTKIDNGLTFSDLVNGNFVEISGFTTASGVTATYVQKQTDTKVEVMGKIMMLDVVARTFEIHGFKVSYNDTTKLENNITLADGLYVQAKGGLDPLDPNILVATKIKAEDDGKGDDMDEEELQGIVSSYDAATMTFNLGTIQVDATSAKLKPASLDLASNPAPEVKVEGHWLNGVLIADKIKQKGRKIKIDAKLSAVGTDTVTFTFNSTDIVVRVNQQTDLKDDTSEADLLIANLIAGDYVEMEAFSDGSGDINAVELKRKSLDKVKIQAPVEAFDEATSMVTLLGISFDLSAVTDFGDSIDAMTFYGTLAEGVFVKLKDTAPGGDGIIDEAQLED